MVPSLYNAVTWPSSEMSLWATPLQRGYFGCMEPKDRGHMDHHSSLLKRRIWEFYRIPNCQTDPKEYKLERESYRLPLSVSSLPCLLGVCISYLLCMRAQSCPTLCNPMDCSPPGSSVHGISQARILEWVVISSSRRSSRPRDWTRVSCVSCIGRWIPYCLNNRGSPVICHWVTNAQNVLVSNNNNVTNLCT